MATKAWWLGIAGLVGQGCLGDALEGSHGAAQEGTRVEVMLIPIDEGAAVSEGSDAFDDALPTTESLDDLARGRGAFVVGVADGWGIALVPTPLTDEAADALDSERDLGAYDDPYQADEPSSCAGDCGVWCTTTLDLCNGDGFDLCDCTTDDAFDDPQQELGCTWDCQQWCVTTLDHCGGDGFDLCDCTDDGAYAEPEEPACTWDCDEWCTTTLDLCDGDGWEICGDTCGWYEAQALPPSPSAGVWTVPLVIGGVTLVLVLTDPEVQLAVERGESIGSAVGGVYGRRAEVIMERLRQIARDMGAMSDDAQLPCTELLAREGYSQQLEVAAGPSPLLRIGICSQDQLTVWPSEITVQSSAASAALEVRFDNFGSGFRTLFSRDAKVTWVGDDGRDTSLTVPEGSNAWQTWELASGDTLPLRVGIPRDYSNTRVSISLFPR